MWKSLAPPPTRETRTSTMGGGRKRWHAPSSTPRDDRDPGALGPAESIVMACQRDIYRYRHMPEPIVAVDREAMKGELGELVEETVE